MFQAILGKLYVVSLFVTLYVFFASSLYRPNLHAGCRNGRAALAMDNADTTPQPLTSLGWGLSRPLTLNV